MGSGLVPQEAVDAAMRQYRLVHPCPDTDPCAGCAVDLTDILEAAAPRIIAAARPAIEREAEANALRTAAARFRVAHAKTGRVIVQIDEWANGLEAGDS